MLNDRLQKLRAIDKLDRLGPVAVFMLLTDGRRDESGDFTPGCGCSFHQARFIMTMIGYDLILQTTDDPEKWKGYFVKWLLVCGS